MKCEAEGCEAEATHLPRICVPVRGCPIDSQEPISALLGFELCHDHCKTFDASVYFDPDEPQSLIDIFAMIAAGRGQCIDTEKKYILPISLTSDQAIALIAERKMMPRGNA